MLSAFGLTMSVVRLSRGLRWRRDVALAEGGPDSEPPRRPRPKDGPPDLDELWQDFNRRINGLLGGKGGKGRPAGGGSGGGGGGGGGFGGFNVPGLKGAGIGAGVLAIVALLVWLASGFFIVQEGQQGVILEFGKYKSTTGAGIQWRLPYPIQAHEVVNVGQVRNVEIGYRQNSKTRMARESLMLTDEENIIDMQVAVQYRIKDPTEFLFKNRNAEDNVMQSAETAIREVVGRNKMDFVLYSGREEMAVLIQQLAQRILDRYNTGIAILNVTILNAQPPEQVQAAFDDAVRARQDRERQKSEGQAYANDVIPRASGTASRLIEEAKGYQQRIVAQSEGDASRFKAVLGAYSKAPGVTRERMYLETMQQIFSNTTKVMVDSRIGNNLLYLPLDKLMAATATDPLRQPVPTPPSGTGPGPGPTSPPAVSAPAPAAPAVQGEADARSRDSLRARDRESR